MIYKNWNFNQPALSSVQLRKDVDSSTVQRCLINPGKEHTSYLRHVAILTIYWSLVRVL